MTVNVAQVLRDAGAGEDDGDLATEVLAEALAYVDGYITTNLVDADNPVPDAIHDSAVLTCSSDLFARRKAPFGQQIMADENGALMPTRLGCDPLGGVRPKLRPWCISIGFAFPVEDT